MWAEGEGGEKCSAMPWARSFEWRVKHGTRRQGAHRQAWAQVPTKKARREGVHQQRSQGVAMRVRVRRRSPRRL